MAASHPTHPLTPASSDSQPVDDRAQPRRGRRIVVAVAAVALAAAAALAVGGGAAASAAASPDGSAHEHHASRGGDIVFGPAPPLIPPGAEMAVLQGDPSAPDQEFTIRLRMPDGYVI